MPTIQEIQIRAADRQMRFMEAQLDLWDKLVRDEEMLDIDGRCALGQTGSTATWSAGLAYTTESQLTELRNQSRHLALTNEFAINALENRVSYVIGEGHSYKVIARAGQEPPDELIDAVDGVVSEFIARNRWHLRQQETRRRLDRDGEAFIRKFVTPAGLEVRFIEPELVANPQSNMTARFGIEFAAGDAETPETYHVQQPGGTRSEPVPAADVQHRKANVDLVVPRGVPVFYPVRKNLTRAAKILRNMSTVSEIQSAIAMVRTHVQGAQATIQQYVSDQADAKVQNNVTGNTRTYRQYPPGTIIDTGPGTQYDFPAKGLDVGKYVQALQAELRAIASRLVMPEFMLSSDASNANYSSTMVAEGPAVKMFERLQADTIWADLEILTAEIELAVARGRLPADTLSLVEIDADGPRVQTRNRLQDTQADQVLYNNKVMSRQTFAGRHGLDYADERDQREQEQERETGYVGPPPQLAAGEREPGNNGDGGDDDPGEGDEE